MHRRSRAGLLGIHVGLIILTLLLLDCATSRIARAAPPTFSDVTVTTGVDYVQHVSSTVAIPQRYISGGAAAADFDGNGWVDLYVTRLDAPDILFSNTGGSFTDVSASAFGATTQVVQSNGAGWGDIDNDGDPDLYVTALESGRNFLYINNGDGSFTEDAQVRGAAIEGPDPHYGQGMAFGDYDNDGFLDIFTTEWRRPIQNPGNAPANTRLLRNLGDANPGHFEDVTIASGVEMSANSAFTPRFTDLDRDGLLDLAVASDFETSKLFWNNGDGTFTDGTIAAMVGGDKNGMGATTGDYDGDGLLDWFVTAVEGNEGNRLYRNLGNRTFSDETDAAGVRNGGFGWGASFFDMDNDGDQDLTMTNGARNPTYENDQIRLWENSGGIYSEVATTAGMTDTGLGQGVVILDFDKDGDLDAFYTNNEGHPVLYQNDSPGTNDWLRIDPTGTVSNRDGVGAFITVIPDSTSPNDFMVHEVSASSNNKTHNELTAHFGLGPGAGTVDELTILWPSGIYLEYSNVAVNSVHTITEPIPGDGSLSGEVGQEDYTIWANNFAAPDPTFEEGDYSGNGINDAGDYTVWANNFGQMSASPDGPAAIPEPASLLLAVMGMLFILPARRIRPASACGRIE